MNNFFKTLLSESLFTNEILVSGITQLENVNYFRNGLYFSSFTSISTGLERIGKLCMIIDYYIQNNGTFPDKDYLKKEIGHDIEKLYKKSITILIQREIKLINLNNLDNLIHANILTILSKFAKGDRYSNIDFLVQSRFRSDPISEWHNKVDNLIYEEYTSTEQKKRIQNMAMFDEKLVGGSVSVRFFAETGEEINTVEKSSLLIYKSESIKKQRQLQVLQIARYFIEILCELENEARYIKEEIPYFKEVFEKLRNEDSYYLDNNYFFYN